MAYLVKITPRAERDLAFLYEDIRAEDSDAAVEWYRGLRDAIVSLEKLPNRGSVTREDADLRQLLYGHKPYLYRIIYRVIEKRKQVDVIHIRHGARHGFKNSDV